jgi:hypothetical protein
MKWLFVLVMMGMGVGAFADQSVTATTIVDLKSNSIDALFQCIVKRNCSLIVSILQPKPSELLKFCWIDFDSKIERGNGVYAIFKKDNKLVLYALNEAEGKFGFVNYGCFNSDSNSAKNMDSSDCESQGGIWTYNRIHTIFKLALKRNHWHSFKWEASNETQMEPFEACP